MVEMNELVIGSYIFLWVVTLFNLVLTIVLIRQVNDNQQMERLPGGKHLLRKGEQAPDFEADTLMGESMRLANLTQRNTALLFISPNCPPCLEEVERLKRQKITSANDIDFLLVIDADKYVAQNFVDEYEISWPVLVAPRDKSAFMSDYKVIATPFYCVVNEHGKIEATGFLDSEWRAIISNSK